MFSLELPKYMTEIVRWSFSSCNCLRNVAFPPNADLSNYIFGGLSEAEQYDLYQLFGSQERIIIELQHRFDGLPIHILVYYQTYHQGVMQRLIAAINMRSGQSRTLRSKLDPTGNQQDCLGMTPLHIMTCSSAHNLEVYRLIVENYPTNLITEDRWGALPLLYAFWGAAPSEIIQFLLESYQSLYPGHIINWTMMVETMGRCSTPKESIANLLHVKQMHFPEQEMDWEYLLDKFAESSHFSHYGVANQERLQFLFMCGMSERVEALPFKVWRDCMTNVIQTADYKYHESNNSILIRIRALLDHFGDKLLWLKEATTFLELALWKSRLDENNHKWGTAIKKIKTDKSSTRQQCRVTCGADVIIGLVLPFVISA
jgi:hypothetical protein